MIFIEPQWPVPKSVKALVSTRAGGVSKKPFDSLNLGDHVGDEVLDVTHNRHIFTKGLAAKPIWLKQTHSTLVSTPQSRLSSLDGLIEADASVTNIPGEAMIIMTADCLPVLFAHSSGASVGAAHTGWRGLCAGILENTIAELLNITHDKNPGHLIAWLGPAIGQSAFEVGEDVVMAFRDSGFTIPAGAFKPISNKSGKYLADIYLLARGRLEARGVKMISGGQYCTVRDQEQFFSYRRDGQTGRFASAIWIAK